MRSRIWLALALALAGCAAATSRADLAPVEAFLARHWRAPLAPQGPPPARFSPLEASLAPEACGACHPAQLADWTTSLHSRSMGPGVAGQLVEMLESDPGSALSCLGCHAPLAEQAPLAPATLAPNPAFDPALAARGIPCAACHVRGHARFGPPRRDGSLASAAPGETLPHGGVTRTTAYLASEFCRGCHQFGRDGFALGGKLLEDTYNEWKASRFAREGVQCQDCHMPDRRHLWRGIHDPEMVRSGLAIDARASASRYRPGDTISVILSVQNTRVGHAFPTYVTPRVVLSAELVDEAGQVVSGSRQEKVIARQVTLDLEREIADTRLMPGKTAVLHYRRRLDRAGLRARVSVVVYPDEFYTRFFEALLAQGAGRGEAKIREALTATRRSPFTVFTQDLQLT
jgi:hypothetical protein